MAQPVMLAFNFAGERLQCLRKVCMSKHIRLMERSSEEASKPLAAFFGMAPTCEAADDVASFTDEVLVMHGFTPGSMNAFLQAWRQAGQTPIRLKAALTPTNLTWTVIQLHKELVKEDNAMQQHEGSVHKHS